MACELHTMTSLGCRHAILQPVPVKQLGIIVEPIYPHGAIICWYRFDLFCSCIFNNSSGFHLSRYHCFFSGTWPEVNRPKARYIWQNQRDQTSQLNLFIAYIFHFRIPLRVFGCEPYRTPHTVPYAIAHCNQNGAGHQTIESPSMPC